jgi:hypothetical protein
MIKTDLPKQRILAEELAPGDLILLAEGDHISADARLIQEAELRVDQSTLKGNGALTSDFTAVGASTPHREGNYSCLYQRGLKPQLDRFIGQQAQAPAPIPIRRLTTGQRGQLGALAAIDFNWSAGTRLIV